MPEYVINRDKDFRSDQTRTLQDLANHSSCVSASSCVGELGFPLVSIFIVFHRDLWGKVRPMRQAVDGCNRKDLFDMSSNVNDLRGCMVENPFSRPQYYLINS